MQSQYLKAIPFRPKQGIHLEKGFCADGFLYPHFVRWTSA
jgi:hypothetical protein